MTTLSRDMINTAVPEMETVDVPEFGDGMTVNVRGMTVGTKTDLLRLLWDQVEVDGKPSAIRNKHNEIGATAAIHAFDDDGNLVFGETIDDALLEIEAMPSVYFSAIVCIASAVNKIGDGNAATVEEAEKN